MGALVLFVFALLLGGWALRPLRLGTHAESLLARACVGLSLAALFILVLGSISLHITQLAVVGLAVLGLGYELFVRSRHEAPLEMPADSRPPLGFIEWFSMLTIMLALAIAFLSALAPVTGWDACVAHLALPKDYAREGRIQLIPGNEYSAYPHLLHCLFTAAFVQGGETAVTLFNCALAGLACLAAYALGKRIDGRRCGLIAAAILATAPIFLDQAGTASIDLAFCAFTLGALALLAAWHDEKRPAWLLLSAILAGSSCGIRHTGYLVCVLLGLAVIFTGCPARLRTTLRFGAFATLAALPWLMRSLVLAGNPFYPFFSDLLGSPDMAHWNVTTLANHSSVADLSAWQLIRFPWDIIMRPQQFDGWSKSPGALILFLGIPGLIVGGKRARALGAFTGAGLVCFFFFERLARYLLPFFAPMMIVAAVAACRLHTLRRAITVLLVVTFLYGLALHAAAIHFKLPVVLGLESREEYLEQRVERYPAFAWVNQNIAPTDMVLTFDRRTYYLDGRSFQNTEPLWRLRDRPLLEQAAWMRAHGIRWVLLPVTYIEESAGYRAQFLDMINDWRECPRSFLLIHSLDLPRPRASGTERIEIYEVL